MQSIVNFFWGSGSQPTSDIVKIENKDERDEKAPSCCKVTQDKTAGVSVESVKKVVQLDDCPTIIEDAPAESDLESSQELSRAGTQEVLTENGAKSLPKTDDPRVDYFFKVLRDTTDELLIEYVKECVSYNGSKGVGDMFKLMFQLRDRESSGKGERSAFLKTFKFLCCGDDKTKRDPSISYTDPHLLPFAQIKTKELCLRNLDNVPYFGRWKDIFELYAMIDDAVVRDEILDYTAEQLYTDMGNSQSDHAEIRRSVSLAAKWLPSEGCAIDKKCHFTSHLAKYMQISKSELRKKFISPLRAHINVTERLICSNRFSEIQYQKVPGGCMRKEKGTFKKHDQIRFEEYEAKLKSGEVKAKTMSVEIHQLSKHYITGNDLDAVIEAVAREKQTQISASLRALRDKSMNFGLGRTFNTLFVVDVSGSMSEPNMIPISSAISLGIFGSASTEGYFKNKVMTFSSKPELVELPSGEDVTFKQKVEACMKMNWGMSTNIHAAFDLVLKTIVENKVPANEVPDMIVIASDMQFNPISNMTVEREGCRFAEQTAFEDIEEKYRAARVKRPTICFWNLRGDTIDFPANSACPEVAMIGGFNPQLLNLLLMEGEVISPSSLVDIALKDERYNRVVTSLH